MQNFCMVINAFSNMYIEQSFIDFLGSLNEFLYSVENSVLQLGLGFFSGGIVN